MSAYSFTDSNGTKYEIRITFRTIFDVAERTGYDLLNPGEQKEDGFLLSNALLTKPLVVARVVAALVGAEDEKAFLDLIDAKSFPAMDEAFWKAYCDFFDQGGREWIAIALRDLLKERTARLAAAKAAMLELPKKTSSESSPSPASPTGSTVPSGNSLESPKPTSDSKRKTTAKSSAPSTTRTALENKTSGARSTSTPTKKPAQKEKRKSS